uniref:Uncharacterized protein n=1 Tax=Arundo donax TaxID=35708 RepID=A0A0A9G8E4_ARUDO
MEHGADTQTQEEKG